MNNLTGQKIAHHLDRRVWGKPIEKNWMLGTIVAHNQGVISIHYDRKCQSFMPEYWNLVEKEFEHCIKKGTLELEA